MTNMLNHNDSSPFKKSPKMQRRKIDFTDKEYQPSVIDRARLTLLNLTDIWKSKIDSNKLNKSYDTPNTANRKAVDVLTVWTRHRRSPSTEPTHSTKSHKRSLFIENDNDECYWHIDNKSYAEKTANGKNNTKCHDASDKGKSKHKLNKESKLHGRQRSYEDNLNQLFYDFKNDVQLPKIRHRRRSWGNFPFEYQCYANKMYTNDRKREKLIENNQNIGKTRLKFKKNKTCDDFYANEIIKMKPNKVLKRQTSVLPIITINDCDEKQSDAPKVVTTKQKKKLSFREPVIFNEKLKAIRSRHASKNQSSSEEDDNVNVSNELMDVNQVPFESQAMRIVRTIGQAFEVCHKYSLQKNSMVNADDQSESQLSDRFASEHISDEDEPKKDPIPVTPEPTLMRPTHLDLMPVSSFTPKKSPNTNDDKSPSAPLSTTSEIQQLRDQLEQQALQTREALFQLMQVREQLISETNARIEAQARTQQLLAQNAQLLEHLASLGGYTYTENERAGLTSANISLAPQLSSTAKVARWFQQLNSNPTSLSRPESGFVSGDSRSERNPDDQQQLRETDEICDEYLLVEGTSNLWSKLSAKKRRKLLGLRLGKVTTF